MFHPPFLNDNDVTWEAQHEYYQILFNKTLTITEQKKKLRAWAKENNLTKEVTSFFTQIGKGVVEMNVSKLIHALPVAFRNLTKILKNENQTMSQMMNAMEKMFKMIGVFQVFSVLDTAMEEVMGKNGPHGSHAKPQGGHTSFDGPSNNIPSRQ
uniref:ANIS5_cation-bd domain-containing protein n=1 Tax=Haemonchus contortus TaxID=6289 RepID=A0A7I4YHH7_HAECO